MDGSIVTASNDAPENSAGQIIPRRTVQEICARRDRTLELYRAAHGTLAVASDAFNAAIKLHTTLADGKDRYNCHTDEAKAHFLNGVKLPDLGKFEAAARKLVDTDVWASIIRMTDLERLMDKTAKDQLHQQLMNEPPEITVENVYATLQQFMLDSDMIFKRGIATCFSQLDRRFRSHDGWKIGSRVILSYAFDGWGSWNYHRNHRDTLHDIDRTFHVLDGGGSPHLYSGIVGVVEAGRRNGGLRRRQSTHESEYFLIRCYQNGNAHVWFKRDDLVEKVNKLLAEYYGAEIPEDREPDPDTGLHTPKTAVAKNYGFFPTPSDAAERVMEKAPIYRPDDDEAPLTVLEPSAGTGNLASLAAKRGALVDCIELNADRAAGLERQGLYRSVRQADFITIQPAELYDVVLMNPPFDRERDIDHVMHALDFLKPSGCLVAVMSAGTEFRDTKKAQAFRDLMQKMRARWTDLPAASFASVGTYMNTVILKVWKDGRDHW